MDAAVEICGLNKYFGRRQVLNDVNLTVNSGEVFGFLGPNGAGKTTTIKIAVGLLSVDEGSVTICGHDIQKDFVKAMECVGAIVENPETYRYLSGMKNLQQYARMRKNVTQEKINEIVELVGLSNRIKEKVSKYSLGMRQRLGLAQALLHDPKVLILDEPTNGLDPAGIKNLRDILKKLAHEKGVCVIVSSHMMSEMELMCDRVGIIVKGSIVDVKTIDELVSQSSGAVHTYHFRVNNAVSALESFKEGFPDVTGHVMDDTHFEISYPSSLGDDYIGQLNRYLFECDYTIYSVNAVTNKHLEDVFLEITQEGGTQIA